MKKIVLALSIIALSTITAQAQKSEGDFKLGVGLHLGLPTGNLSNISSFGLGGEVQGEYVFAENLTGVGTVGYTSFFGKTISGSAFGYNYSTKTPSSGHIPIIVGARYYATEQIFAGAQIGLGIYTGGGGSSSGFEYRPQVGYNFEPFQFILSYDGVSVSGGSLGHIGLTALYTFGAGK